MPVFHKNLTGENLHQPGYVQNTDPGAIGAGKLWVDISTTGDADTTPTVPASDYSFKVRDASDVNWIIPNTFNNIKATVNASAATDADAPVIITRYRNSLTSPTEILVRNAPGTKASPTAVTNTQVIGGIKFQGSGNTTPSWVTGASIYAKAVENFSTTAAGTAIFFDVATLLSTTLATALTITGGSAGATTVTVAGTLDHDGTSAGFYGAAPVTRQTYGAPTGTPTRTTFATGSVTLPQLAERVKAMIDDLRSVGLFA